MTTIAEVESTLSNFMGLFQDEANRKHNTLWGFETEISNNWRGADKNALMGKVTSIHSDIDTIWSQCNNVYTNSMTALKTLQTYRTNNNLDENGNPIPVPEEGEGCR